MWVLAGMESSVTFLQNLGLEQYQKTYHKIIKSIHR